MVFSANHFFDYGPTKRFPGAYRACTKLSIFIGI